jgi:hypothetical protein
MHETEHGDERYDDEWDVENGLAGGFHGMFQDRQAGTYAAQRVPASETPRAIA